MHKAKYIIGFLIIVLVIVGGIFTVKNLKHSRANIASVASKNSKNLFTGSIKYTDESKKITPIFDFYTSFAKNNNSTTNGIIFGTKAIYASHQKSVNSDFIINNTNNCVLMPKNFINYVNSTTDKKEKSAVFTSAAISPNGKTALVGITFNSTALIAQINYDSTLNKWVLPENNIALYQFNKIPSYVKNIKISSDGKTAIAVIAPQNVKAITGGFVTTFNYNSSINWSFNKKITKYTKTNKIKIPSAIAYSGNNIVYVYDNYANNSTNTDKFIGQIAVLKKESNKWKFEDTPAPIIPEMSTNLPNIKKLAVSLDGKVLLGLMSNGDKILDLFPHFDKKTKSVSFYHVSTKYIDVLAGGYNVITDFALKTVNKNINGKTQIYYLLSAVSATIQNGNAKSGISTYLGQFVEQNNKNTFEWSNYFGSNVLTNVGSAFNIENLPNTHTATVMYSPYTTDTLEKGISGYPYALYISGTNKNNGFIDIIG